MSYSEAPKGINTTRKDLFYWCNSLLVLFFIFGFGFLPAIEPLSTLGMQVLGIFIGLLYGWTFVDMIWPSIMGLISLGLTSYSSVNKVILEGFGDSTTVLVIFIFIFAAYLNDVGLSSAIANWFISRKIGIGRPWVFSLMILLSAYVLGATVSLFAGIVLIWNIFYSICDTVGFKKGDRYPTIMLIGIVYASMLGFAIFPFKALQIMVLGSLEKVSGLTVNFLDFTLLSFVISACGLLGFVALCKFIFKPNVELLESKTDHFVHLRGAKLNGDQKGGVFFLVFFMLAMFIPSILPTTTFLGAFFSKLGTTGSIVFVVGVLAIVRFKEKRLMDFTQMAIKGINWEMVILFAATMPVSHAMSSPESGVMDFLVHLLNPLFEGMNPILFGVVILLIAGLVTQVAHNLVLGAVMTPILYKFSMQLGADPVLLTTLLAFALAVAIATPGGSAPGALIYVNREWIDIKSAYSYSAAIVALTLVIILAIGLPLGHLIF